MKQIAEKLSTHIAKSMDLSKHYSIIHFAILAVLEDLTTLLAAVLITYICFGTIHLSLIFAAAFAILRRFAGGIHCCTYRNCVIATICIFCMSIWSVQNVNEKILLIFAIAASCEVWLQSPVETPDRITNLRQNKRSQYIAREILIFYWCSIFLLDNSQARKSIQMAIIMICILQLLGKYLLQDKTMTRNLTTKLRLRPQMSMVILTICTFICQNTVQCESKVWGYQENIPSDILRKFEDM